MYFFTVWEVKKSKGQGPCDKDLLTGQSMDKAEGREIKLIASNPFISGTNPPMRVEPANLDTSHWGPFSNSANAVSSIPDGGFWEDTFKPWQPLQQRRKRNKKGEREEATRKARRPGVGVGKKRMWGLR